VENLLPRGMLGTPRRTITAGIVALVLAAILLFVYLSHYRSSVKGSSADVPVLVAKKFIPKGTPALVAANKGLYAPTGIPKAYLKTDAVTDPAVFSGMVAVDNISPGQQLTLADFAVTATSSTFSASPDLTGTWRAISIALDSTHGISPQAQTGDHVDVYVQVNTTMGLLLSNVLVLAAPNQAAAGTTAPTSGNYIFRVPTSYAPRFAYAAQNNTIWLALRPQNKPSTTHPGLVTQADVLGGQ
jgi:Flp pilus assembly protein CpaB